MKKRSLLAWVMLGAFLVFSLGVPLGHDCFDHVAINTPIGPATLFSHSHASSHPVDANWEPSGHPQKDDLCPACFWTRTLLLNDVTTELADSRLATPVRILIPVPAVICSDFSRSTLLRGPPRSPAL